MDEMKVKLADAVAGKLAAAPQSDAKDELIEELSDNLYRRFLDMTSAGMGEEDAFHRALDDLGDVDELLAYLGVEDSSSASIQGKDGQTITINMDSGDKPVVINGAGSGRIVLDAGDAREEAGDTREEAKSGDRQGSGGQFSQSDLDAILTNVSEMCRIAMDQARDAVMQAKEAIKSRTTWEKDNGHVRVQFNTHPDSPTPPEPPESPEPPEPPESPEPPEPPAGWEFEAELDSDEGRFFAGAGPKQRKDIIYGFGYDKAKGGFFTQWGEYQGGCQSDPQEGRGPYFSGAGAFMECKDDGSYSVTALKDLRGIEVQTTAGDVLIHVSEAPDAGVIIDGDVDELNVTCSADGVLTIREGRTASSSFFSRRGFCSADVELFLPRRHWEMISVHTASGDVEIDRDGLDIGRLFVSTANGDLSCRLRACAQLNFKSASGDLELSGTCTDLNAETMSGDILLHGRVDQAHLNSASGDIEVDGLVNRFLGKTMSGDVRVETSQLPLVMEMSSKSGDCEARIPDAGPFTVRMKTVSGEMSCAFPINYINGVSVYGDGSGPAYSMTTVSGDVVVERY